MIELPQDRLGGFVTRLCELAAREEGPALTRVLHMIECAMGTRERAYALADYQPVTLCMPGLAPRPFHASFEGPLADLRSILSQNLAPIRAEALALWEQPELFAPFAEQAFDPDKFAMRAENWKEAYLVGGASPALRARARAACPQTVAVLEQLNEHITGDVSFSMLQGNSVIPPHFGEINSRLTVHLPLQVPNECGLQVADQVHEVREGEVFIFDDGFRHHAWNRSAKPRLHMILMIWNPALTSVEREAVDLVRHSFQRRPVYSTSQKLLTLLLNGRAVGQGDAQVLAEIGINRLQGFLQELQAELADLLADPLRAQSEALEVYRDAGLLPALQWDLEERGPFPPHTALQSRDAQSFALLRGPGKEGQVTRIKYRDRMLEIDGAASDLVTRVLDGRAFEPQALAQRAGLQLEQLEPLLALLWQEGLLQAHDDASGAHR